MDLKISWLCELSYYDMKFVRDGDQIFIAFHLREETRTHNNDIVGMGIGCA